MVMSVSRSPDRSKGFGRLNLLRVGGLGGAPGLIPPGLPRCGRGGNQLKPRSGRVRPLVLPAKAGPGRVDEARLLSAARKGDAAALTELLERAAGPAHRFSRGFCRDTQDAEDLVQDVLAALMRSLESFRGDSSISTWTYVVARRACGRLRK